MINYDKLNRIAKELGIEVTPAYNKGNNLRFVDNNGYVRPWNARVELGLNHNKANPERDIEITDLKYKFIAIPTSTINYLIKSKSSLKSKSENVESFGERQCKISI